MYVVIGIILIILIGLVIFYYRQCEKANIEIYNLKCLLDDKVVQIKQLEKKVKRVEEEKEGAMNTAEKEISERLYTLVFQNQNFGSLEDLQNKIKTVLDDLGNH